MFKNIYNDLWLKYLQWRDSTLLKEVFKKQFLISAGKELNIFEVECLNVFVSMA
jgi:hypothetical protein